MTQIVLTPDQVKLYNQAKEPVQVCDTQGKVLGTLPPDFSAEFVAELKRRARTPGTRFTSEQVTRHMQALADVWQREGPLDEKRTLEVLEEIRSEGRRMKSYQVEWDKTAEDLLATFYLRIKDPNTVWPAQYRADRRLEQRPRTAGVELSEGLWQIVEPPLKVFYEIDDAKRLVTVTYVQLI